jgi:hypothetical protein
MNGQNELNLNRDRSGTRVTKNSLLGICSKYEESELDRVDQALIFKVKFPSFIIQSNKCVLDLLRAAPSACKEKMSKRNRFFSK